MTTRYQQAARALLREQVLDAAYAQVAAVGWSKLGIAGLAREAGVSRQTVYNEFGTKEAIADALVAREVDRFMTGIVAELDAHPEGLLPAATAGVTFVLRQAADNSLVKAVLTAARGGTDEGLLSYLTIRQEPVFDVATALLDAYAETAWPEVDAHSRSLAVETIVRLTVSHIVQPHGAPEQSAARIALITTRVAYPAA
ncbi:TetR/AcrR family transcriptional regulator [Streptacidiphilus jiangxiensis]|uniref:DNA-binding transcriptional regulator, AcrR family n=1 Tax=Streptacidiphilus jiangxiensis TaxID=235985 RepID=A0A1H7USS0_STRJI|nr:TetR family transcriptional regulator [Streptacidiphilus jiangxiensis]SEM00040.1 DNA-binding transcriptional regulator, AcrR family [Streptacidiphilus jiangxiensis]